MKELQKIVRLFVLSALAVVFLCLPVQASGSGQLAASDGSVKVGETIKVTVSLPQNPGLITLKIAVAYDSDLELVSVEDAQKLPGWVTPSPTIASPYTLFWKDSLSTTNHTQTGTLATLTFKAKATATPGAKTVTISCTESRDKDGQKNTIASASATVTVNCATHNFGVWTQTKAPTCTDKGTETRTCSACGAKETRDVAATGHSFGAWTQTKAPTCTEKGTESRTCSKCKKVETRDVAATGHTFGAWTQTKAPTCTDKGTETRTCSKCKKSETRDIAALGHQFSSPKVTKEATCTTEGVSTGTCTRCGKTTSQAIKALGHSWGAWQVTKAAGCEETGEETRTCSRDKNHTEKRTTQALGHDFEDPQIVKEATLTETGLLQGKCKRCGKTTDQVIPCKAVDTSTGVEVQAEEGTFEKGTELKVEPITLASATYQTAKAALANVSEKFEVYELTAVLNGAEAQPQKPVTVTLPVPEGFSDKTALYIIAEDGTATELEATLSEDGKMLIASTTSFGKVAVVDVSAGVSTPETTEEPSAPASTETPTAVTTEKPGETEPENKPWIIGVIAAVALVAIVGVVVVFVMKKKKK